MLPYLGRHLLAIMPIDEDGSLDAYRLRFMAVIGGTWSWCLDHVVSGYVHAALLVPVSAVLLLWCCDMITGTLAAIVRGGWRSWSPTRAKGGVAKLVLLWLPAVGICYLLRDSHVFGAGLFAGILEAYVIFAEAGSVLKNLGRLNNHAGMTRAGEIAEGRADSLLERAEGKATDLRVMARGRAESLIETAEVKAETLLEAAEAKAAQKDDARSL
jgi:phage-related holin